VNYRDRLDIIADILQVADQPARKTQIMYQANLSHSLLQKYLAEIVEADLVSFEVETNSYQLTFKGQEFLQAYKNYSKTNKVTKRYLNNLASKRRLLEEMCSKQATDL
jgi:predicted transcriptional regulator